MTHKSTRERAVKAVNSWPDWKKNPTYFREGEAMSKLPTRIPLEVKFVDRDYGYPQSIPNQPVVEWVQMPSGDYVVRIPGGEALWFDPSGHHPKSDLIFVEHTKERGKR